MQGKQGGGQPARFPFATGHCTSNGALQDRTPSPLPSPSSCKQHPQPAGPHPVPTATYPVAAAMTQPPCSGVASTQQPVLSWLMPKLWPISWAIVAAAPMGCSEWSCIGMGHASAQQPGAMERGDPAAGNAVGVMEGPQHPWDCNWIPWEGQRKGWRRIHGSRVWSPKSPTWDCWEALLLEPTAENLEPWKAHPKTQKPRCPTPPPCLGTTGHQGHHHPTRRRIRVIWGRDDPTKPESTCREQAGAIQYEGEKQHRRSQHCC